MIIQRVALLLKEWCDSAATTCIAVLTPLFMTAPPFLGPKRLQSVWECGVFFSVVNGLSGWE